MSIDRLAVFAALALLINMAPMLQAGDGICWIQFTEETATRLVSDPGVGTGDPDEKDYAWGDVDNDGDTDLVVARKEPFSTPGRRTNVLFINEGVKEGHRINGVLVDRTAEFATDSDVEGDMGFLTPTNDRDIALADVNNDGWLDIITATTTSDDQPKHIGHPRIYINKGESNGVWQGFRFENDRFPQLFTTLGLAVNPRFTSVSPVDIDQDNDVDLFFVDMDSSEYWELGYSQEPPEFDTNDRLLVNDGNGYFDDQTTARMTPEMYDVTDGYSSAVGDMNGDGLVDIVRQSGYTAPINISIAYNNPDRVGTFSVYQTVMSTLPQNVSVGDLNNDGWNDMVVSGWLSDYVRMHSGVFQPSPDGSLPLFFQSSFHGILLDAFPTGNSLIVDLNQDGFKDVLISPVHTDRPGCGPRLYVFRNYGEFEGPTVYMNELSETDDKLSPGWRGAPGLPSTISGVFDMAVFDVDGDGNNDMILGKCDGTQLYMGAPWSEGDASTCTCGHKGDCDGDCNIDLVDFANFQTCYTGPGSAWAEGCWCSDFDDDGDVDLADFAQFQIAFTGP